MWAISTVSSRLLFPHVILPRPGKKPEPPNAQPSRRRAPKQEEHENQTQEGGGGGENQLKGLDVLWAMQKAAAERNRGGSTGAKQSTRRKRLVSKTGRRDEEEEEELDYSKVRPLNIKSEWAAKLDELDKRLEDLSLTK